MKKKVRNVSSSPDNNTGNLIIYDYFEACDIRPHAPHGYFTDNHLVPAAGDYEPIQRKKQHTLLPDEQHTAAILTLLISYESLDHNRE